MGMPMDRDRALLRHFLGAIAYRTQKALRDAPAHYPAFSAGNRVRTPVELIRHMTSLMGYVRTLFQGGSYPVKPEPLPSFTAEVERFHEMVEAVGTLLASNAKCSISTEQLLQGPFADTMTHVGQLAMLRRLADAPVAPENFIYPDIRDDRLHADQPPPARPDKHWPEGGGWGGWGGWGGGGSPVIVRIWHGWTTRANADAYEHLLQQEIFVGIRGRQIKGFRDIQLLRRALQDAVEFV